MHNLLSMLILSKGVPMLLMGDEFARTQKGNNNAFCQDNEIAWVDWKRCEEGHELVQFTAELIRLRKSLDYFKNGTDYKISWHGIYQGQPDWSYYSRSIACFMEGKESLFFVANSYYEPLVFELPQLNGKWQCVINTAEPINPQNHRCYTAQFEVKAYSVCLFKIQLEDAFN